MHIASITPTGRQSKVTVSDEVFGRSVHRTTALLAQAVRVYQSRRRQGTAAAKTRAGVELTKRKWYRQKGTGRARHGAQSAPLFVGGGVAHGPTGSSNWQLALSKQQRQAALKAALSLQAEQLVVVDAIDKLSGKTAAAARLIAQAAPLARRVLVVLDRPGAEVVRSLRNLGRVELTSAAQLNALEVIAADAVVLTTQSLAALEKRLSGDRAQQADGTKS